MFRNTDIVFHKFFYINFCQNVEKMISDQDRLGNNFFKCYFENG